MTGVAHDVGGVKVVVNGPKFVKPRVNDIVASLDERKLRHAERGLAKRM
jgi:hypothetical protein